MSIQTLAKINFSKKSFSIINKESVKKINWKKINSIHVFKVEFVTIQKISLEIFFGKESIIINEDDDGWHQFILQMKENLLNVYKDWDLKVILSDWPSDNIILYQKSKHFLLFF